AGVDLRADISRILVAAGSAPDQRCTTDSTTPLLAQPTENQRSSVSVCSRSATVSKRESWNTVEARSKVTPCLRAFASALTSSHSNWNGPAFTDHSLIPCY